MNQATLPIFIILSIIVLFLLCVGIIIFINRSHVKINKIKLQEKENELKFQNELLHNTVKIKENERNRIATELHDDIGSKLSVIHLNLHLLKKSNHLTENEVQLLDQIDTSLKMAIERTREVSHELLPQVFKKFGIHHALNEFTYRINSSQTILLQIKSNHLIKITDKFKLLHIYRIIQELTQNTIKYAHAKNIVIEFKEEEDDTIILQYSDDGIGFDVSSDTYGLGISNILARSKLLNANTEFESIPNVKGMKFTAKFINHD